MENEILRQRLAEGLELAKRGDYAGARQLLEALCAEAPESVDAHYYHGLACKRLQDFESARAAWERCLSIDPFHHQARTQLSALGAPPQPDFLSDTGNTARFFGEEPQGRAFQPAPLGARTLAFFIDGMLFGFASIPVMALVLFYLIGSIGTGSDFPDWADENFDRLLNVSSVVAFVFQLVVIPFYYYESGMTPGKRLLGMRIVDAATLAPLSAIQSVGRYLASYLSSCAIYLGYLLAFFNRERRTLHDFLAGTVVASSATVPMTAAEKIMTTLVVLLAIGGSLVFFAGVFFITLGVMDSIGSAPLVPF